MKLSAKDQKAISWYIKDRKCRPMLSAPPQMHFRDKEGGEVVVGLDTIIDEYNAWNEQDKKERAREKRVAETRRLIKSGIPGRRIV